MSQRFRQRSAADTAGAVVDLVRSSGAISRTELAEKSGLTEASISRIVKRLLERNLLVEVGQASSTGGKPRTLLQLRGDGRLEVGVAVDVDQVDYVLINLVGERLASRSGRGLGKERPPDAVRSMGEEIAGMLADAGVSRTEVAGIGLALPGRHDPIRRRLRSQRLTSDWEKFAVEPELAEVTGLPVTLEHDYVSAVVGEFWVGRVPATSNMACLYMATGFGLGMLLGGQVYRGSSHNAGEIGHLVLDVDGPDCWCGSQGCLEAVAGPRRVVERARELPGVARALQLSGDGGAVRDEFAKVARAAMAGDAQCREIVEDSARYVAAAVLSTVNTLDLDRVMFAGRGFADAGPIYLEAARTAVSKLSFLREVSRVTIEMSQLGLAAAAVGAATLSIRKDLATTVGGPSDGRGSTRSG
ncbi:ROK family transcriptional regulator [Georgenia alba]|uniref:ROK family protein n=1 Tax=Georgenia alba TaxID=2233858 RepID=A0ABW2Q840_9MICO